MTNYERIKAMSVEEMGKFIHHCETTPCYCCTYKGDECKDAEMCKNEILKWLNSEVENGNV